MKIKWESGLGRAGRVFMFPAALPLVLAASLTAQDFGAQGRPSNQPPQNIQAQAPKTAQSGAPQDLMGYWVSEVTAFCRYRIVGPDTYDYAHVQLTPEGRQPEY